MPMIFCSSGIQPSKLSGKGMKGKVELPALPAAIGPKFRPKRPPPLLGTRIQPVPPQLGSQRISSSRDCSSKQDRRIDFVPLTMLNMLNLQKRTSWDLHMSVAHDALRMAVHRESGRSQSKVCMSTSGWRSTCGGWRVQRAGAVL